MDEKELVVSINTYNAYLGKIVGALGYFRENLQESNYQELNSMILAVFDGLKWVEEANLSFVQLGYLKVEKQQQFVALVKVFRDALENRDYIFLHDFLEYDLIPFLKELNLSGTIKI